MNIPVLITIVLILSGCAAHPTDRILADLSCIPDSRSKDGLIKIIGVPDDTKKIEDREVWVWRSSGLISIPNHNPTGTFGFSGGGSLYTPGGYWLPETIHANCTLKAVFKSGVYENFEVGGNMRGCEVYAQKLDALVEEMEKAGGIKCTARRKLR